MGLHLLSRSKKKIHNILAIIGGIACWFILGQSQLITRWTSIPVYFYDKPTGYIIDAPESLKIKIQGKRSSFAYLNDTYAIHINVADISEGTYQINPDSHQLFLPESLKMIDYIAMPYTVKTQKPC